MKKLILLLLFDLLLSLYWINFALTETKETKAKNKSFFDLPTEVDLLSTKIQNEMTVGQQKKEGKLKKENDFVLNELPTAKNPFISKLPQPPQQETTMPTETSTEQVKPKPPEEHTPAIQRREQTNRSQQNIRELQPPNLTIKGIIWNTNRPQAIINDRVVDVGDTLDDAKIISIEKSKINVLYKGKEFSMPFGK